jgi:hypothetical protein
MRAHAYLGKLKLQLGARDRGARSCAQDCSIWQSYYRCIGIHGTNGMRASRNMAYDVTGHSYNLGDGAVNPAVGVAGPERQRGWLALTGWQAASDGG